MAGTNLNVERLAVTPTGVLKPVVPKLEFEPWPDEVIRRFPQMAVVEERRNRQLQKWLQLLEKNLGELRTVDKQ